MKTGAGGITEKFSEFIIPEVPVSEEAERTHGYNSEYIRSHGGKTAKEVISDFAKFCENGVLVGHNSGNFDDVLLLREAKKHGVSLNATAFYDTLKISELFSPDLEDRRLATICEKFGIENERAHDALSDVLATEKCLMRYIEDYILPTESDRKRLIALNREKYERLFEAREKILGFAEAKNALGLVRYADETFGLVSGSKRRSDRDIANDFYAALKEMDGADDPKAFLANFSSLAALSSSQMDIAVKKTGKVPLITVHQSKGCEFDAVILIGAAEDEFPSYGAKTSGNEDEEKRIFYVALSRAKKRFIISYRSCAYVGSRVYPRKVTPYAEKLPAEAVSDSVLN